MKNSYLTTHALRVYVCVCARARARRILVLQDDWNGRTIKEQVADMQMTGAEQEERLKKEASLKPPPWQTMMRYGCKDPWRIQRPC